VTEDADRALLARALDLSARALGNTAPNPPVGALVVRDGTVLGEGHTQPAGSHHAEVMALRDCAARGHDPRGATMYVTLEPCRHHGRTPPCTDAIVGAGIARVVVGVKDPFPPMRGASLAQLRESGVAVTLLDDPACAERIRGFARAVTEGLPEVIAKAATSLDGRIATASGESRWITSEAARLDGHRLRAECDAVLVGISTVVADDPRLTCRAPGVDRAPVPVVLDTHLRIPDDAAVLRGPRRALVYCGPDAPERALEATVVRVELDAEGRPDVTAVARDLVKRGLHRVLVEGGGTVIRSFVDAGLLDELHLYLAPLALPGGRPWLGGPRITALRDAPRFEILGTEVLGPDLHLTCRVAGRAGGGGG
jgi:diaminohydroxyphosphoribosylaminopyrimidine deaminase/5-amino-6-(5-phosphoribosylamino)uracil reductase